MSDRRETGDEGAGYDVDAEALTGAQVTRLLELTEQAVTRGMLTPTDAEELFGILEDADVDGIDGDLDEADLEARLTDALKIAQLLLAARDNAARYASRAGLRTGARMLDAVLSSESPVDVIEESADIAVEEFERLGLDLGVEGARRRERTNGVSVEGPMDAETLRARGTALLERSADVDHEEPVHPAFGAILEELAADEARILRLLGQEGPQPVVDVRDKGWLPFSSTPIAADLTMLCIKAGCRYDDRTGAYVVNLQRLGLVWIADEPLDDLERYRVLEAQPQVETAMDRASRPTTVRRSVHLTPLGTDFCETVLGVDVGEDHSDAGYVPPEDPD